MFPGKALKFFKDCRDGTNYWGMRGKNFTFKDLKGLVGSQLRTTYKTVNGIMPWLADPGPPSARSGKAEMPSRGGRGIKIGAGL